MVKNNISLTNNGSNTTYNECFRINPGGGSRWVQKATLISNNDCYQANGTTPSSTVYLDVDYCDLNCKIVNNTEARGCIISTGSNNTYSPTLANNN